MAASMGAAREWLLAKMSKPVREPPAPKVPRVSLKPRKGIAHRAVRKRSLVENATA